MRLLIKKCKSNNILYYICAVKMAYRSIMFKMFSIIVLSVFAATCFGQPSDVIFLAPQGTQQSQVEFKPMPKARDERSAINAGVLMGGGELIVLSALTKIDRVRAKTKQRMGISFSNRFAFHAGGVAEIPIGAASFDAFIKLIIF